MTKDVHAFWQWVQQRMEEVGIQSFRELERRAQVSAGLISSRRNELKFPTVQMAEGMCHALQVSWIDLWDKAGYIKNVGADQLAGLDAEIHEALRETNDDFKGAVLKTIRAWLTVYDDRS